MAETPPPSKVPQIFDRRAASAKWARARSRQASEDSASYLLEAMVEDIADRLDFMRVEPGRGLVIGDVGGSLDGLLRERGWEVQSERWGEWDEEAPVVGPRFDLIVHLLGLGAVNDLPGAMIHARNALRDGGLFFAAFPGAGSAPSLRQIALEADGERPAARMHPLVDIRAGTALLQRAGFARQVVDSYPLKVRFSSFEQLVSDLRDHGLTRSLASPTPALTRDWVGRAEAAFAEMREEDGKVSETFDIVVMTGWR